MKNSTLENGKSIKMDTATIYVGMVMIAISVLFGIAVFAY
jgi:hypothetical protein